MNEKIEKFYEENPKGKIQVEILRWENGMVFMKTSVYKREGETKPIAQGFAYEKEADGWINKESMLESCEKTAVERALIMLRYEMKRNAEWMREK